MKIISSSEGYSMIVNGRIPKLTKAYILKNVIDKDIWSSLFLTSAEENLRVAIRRHLSGLGANVTQQLMDKLTIDNDLLKACRSKYSSY